MVFFVVFFRGGLEMGSSFGVYYFFMFYLCLFYRFCFLFLEGRFLDLVPGFHGLGWGWDGYPISCFTSE